MIASENYVLSSRVEDFAGWGSAITQWQRIERNAPAIPYADHIVDHARLMPETRDLAERALRALFTRDEAATLGRFFAETYPALAENLHTGMLQSPFHADELLALVEAEPHPDAARCLVRLPADGRPPPVPIVGIAAPWSWPALTPPEVSRLIGLRSRLGHEGDG